CRNCYVYPHGGKVNPFRQKVVPEQIEQGKDQEDIYKTVVFAFQNTFQREREGWLYKTTKPGQHRSHLFGVFIIGFPEFIPQELLFGKHYPFVIEPVNKNEQYQKDKRSDKQYRTEPHQKIADVQRVPYKGIDTCCI